MSDCHHIFGYVKEEDVLMMKSPLLCKKDDLAELDLDITYFKYCPECGKRLRDYGQD
jgi:hypothetical protein